MVTKSNEGVWYGPLFSRLRYASRFMDKKESLTIPGRYEAIRRVCEFVAEGANRAGFDEDGIFQVQLACDEACTNVIEHTYKDEGAGEITVTWEIGRGSFIVTIKDSGERFDPDEIPPAPVPRTPLSTEEDEEFDITVGGLGVYFMRTLMDKVAYFYKEGNGNILTMEKKLPGNEAE